MSGAFLQLQDRVTSVERRVAENERRIEEAEKALRSLPPRPSVLILEAKAYVRAALKDSRRLARR